MAADLDRLAGTCLLPGFQGVEVPDWLRHELEAGLGGVILFSRNIRDYDQARHLCEQLRADDAELLIGLDEEGGDVTRLELAEGSSYPGANALGAIDDVDLTRAVARAQGVDLARVGLDLNLAPVADVNSDPRNPVIGIRSFGDDPELVARHVVAYVEGLQAVGVAACVKHFPGHGETHVDSHLGLPVVDIDLETLHARELVPFRAAIAAGARSLMTAHLVVPAVDSRPATLSAAHLTALLRDELGYEGVVITDALEMGAIANDVGMGEGAVLALAAGADALCLGAEIEHQHVVETRSAIVAAVRGGQLAETRLVEAAARVSTLRDWTCPLVVDVDRGVGLDAARRAVEVVGSVALSRSPFVIELVPDAGIAAGPASHTFAKALSARDASTRATTVTGPEGVEAALAEANGHQLVLVVRDPERFAWVAGAASNILASSPDAVVVDVGLPRRAPGARVVSTHGAGRVNYEAAAELLLPR